MHKNALILLKNCKNRSALGPPMPSAAGGSAPKLSPKPLPLKIPGYATVYTALDYVAFAV